MTDVLPIFFLLLFGAVYFLPTIIALAHRKKRKNSVFLVNLLFGWTLLGWVVAYVMQDYSDTEPSRKWCQ